MLRRALLVAAALAIPSLTSLGSVAHAGGYVSAGIGTAPDLGGDVGTMLSADGHAGRLVLGHKLGPAAIEAGLGGFGVTGYGPSGAPVNGTALSADIALKLQATLTGHLGFFARGSLDRTWVSSDSMDSMSGSGHTLGLGLDYGVDFLASGGVWLEADRQYLDLADRPGTADTVMLGLRFGL
jgi:hypothetical protein